MFTAKIIVNYKPGILDPEAKTINKALSALGYADINDVVTGKYFELSFKDGVDKAKAEQLTKESCDKLLANPVIQNYTYELIEVK